jgi:hypothetical protein
MRSRRKRGGAVSDAPASDASADANGSKSIFSAAKDYLSSASEGVLGKLTGTPTSGPTKKNKSLMNSLFSSKPEPGLASILDALNDQKDLLSEKITKAEGDLQSKESSEEQTHAAKVTAENELNILRQHNQMLEKWIDEGTNFTPGQQDPAPVGAENDFRGMQNPADASPFENQEYESSLGSPPDSAAPPDFANESPLGTPADTPTSPMESSGAPTSPLDMSGTPSSIEAQAGTPTSPLDAQAGTPASPLDAQAGTSPLDTPGAGNLPARGGKRRKTKRRLRRYKYSRKRSRLTRGRER